MTNTLTRALALAATTAILVVPAQAVSAQNGPRCVTGSEAFRTPFGLTKAQTDKRFGHKGQRVRDPILGKVVRYRACSERWDFAYAGFDRRGRLDAVGVYRGPGEETTDGQVRPECYTDPTLMCGRQVP